MRTMPLPDQAIDRVAAYFHALSDPTRLRILNALRQSDHSVGELTGLFQCSQANISKHLRVLADAGIVNRIAHGTTTLVSVADPTIDELCVLVCDSITRDLEKNLVLHKVLKSSKRT
jgi:DNA-binding transcriptional ArsR family regulator